MFQVGKIKGFDVGEQLLMENSMYPHNIGATRIFLTIKGRNSPLRIAFIHNKYIGYRLPLFEKLAKTFDITFFFDQVDPKTKVQKDGFVFKVLKSISILKTSIYDCTLSPTILYNLLKGRYNFFIGAGIGHPATHAAFIVSRLIRKPFVLCNEVWYRPRTILRSLIWPFVKVMIQKSDAIIVPGSKAKEFVISKGANPKKVFIAPNASSVVIDKDIVSKKEKLRKELRIENKKIILYFGRLTERKGVSSLIKAFSKLQEEMNESFLVIAGDGEDRKKLEKICLELKTKDVLFVGYIDEKDKSLYYSLGDIFVLPSFTHSGEVWDLVLNEAMSLAKPVISTTAVGASYDLIKNGINGYVVKDRDESALCEAIKKLLRNPKRMKKMGLESKRIIEEGFSFDRMAEGFVRAIKYVTDLHCSSGRETLE